MTHRNWNSRADNGAARLARAGQALGERLRGKLLSADAIGPLLEAVIEPFDRVCLEGDNQKQADFLANALVQLDPKHLHDLHMVQSVLTLPEHLDLFENGIAPQARFLLLRAAGCTAGADWFEGEEFAIGAIHTYLELFARYFVDLTPKVALIAAHAADRKGNLYTGAEHRGHAGDRRGDGLLRRHRHRPGQRDGRRTLPRIDIPADWVDFVVQAPRPNSSQPLFTRDPGADHRDPGADGDDGPEGHLRRSTSVQCAEPRHRLRHRGDRAAAADLWRVARPEGQDLQALGGEPAAGADPGHRSGLGRDRPFASAPRSAWRTTSARVPTSSSPAPTAVCEANRAFCQAAGHYACDLFIGSTLQIDLNGNSSTATLGRIAGFGGAPNMGADARGRRHVSPAWLKAGREARQGRSGAAGTPRGQKLVVQMVETFREHMQPAFVEQLDAWQLAEQSGMQLPPIMIYGDDVTHILTEEGIANLLLCRSDDEREQAIRGVAGYTSVGLARDRRMVENLRDRGVIRRAQDLRHRPARRHPQPAGRPQHARPRACFRRPVPAAQAVPQLVHRRIP